MSDVYNVNASLSVRLELYLYFLICDLSHENVTIILIVLSLCTYLLNNILYNEMMPFYMQTPS